MEKTRVMLIDPPGFMGMAIGRILGSFGINKADNAWPPYDIQVFAGFCKENLHDFKILDANNTKMDYKDVKKEIQKYNPDWVIYMTCFPNFDMDSKVAKVAKEVSPKIRTACMSLSIFSVESPDGKMKAHPYLDFMPWGEPEIPLMKLINGAKPDKVKGLFYNQNGKVKFTGGVAEQVCNLDILGTPTHSPLPTKIYKCPLSISLPMTIVNCSRGCTNSCTHCQAGNFQSLLRYRSVESVLKELDEIKSLGIKEIKFYDCSLPTNKKFTIELCKKMIERKYNFTWNCNARAEFVNSEVLFWMKKAGCHTVAIGCESTDSEVLKKMNKNETVEELERGVRLVKKAGMRVLMYMCVGFEGETEKTMQGNYNFAKRLKPEFVTFGIVVPAPGTPFYKMVKEKGYLIDKKPELRDASFLPSFSYPHLSARRIHAFTRSAYRNYYFNPLYIMRRIASLRSFTELKMNVTNAISIAKRYCFERVR